MTEPLWSPGPVRRQTANIRRFIDLARSELDPGIFEYRDLHRYSVQNPSEFWRAVWDFCEIVGTPGQSVLENGDQMPGARWFPQASLNFAENLLRHRDDRPALIFRSETGETAELQFQRTVPGRCPHCRGVALRRRGHRRPGCRLHAQCAGDGDCYAGHNQHRRHLVVMFA